MRTSVLSMMLLLVTLLLVSGCGGGSEQGETPSEEASPETTALAVPDETATVGINTARGERVEVQVEVADEEAEQQRGLMERTALAEEAGMLFVFRGERPLSFWMKDTLIPLSIAFVDDHGRIVGVREMDPCDADPCQMYGADRPYVLAIEANEGWFERHGIDEGDRAELEVTAYQ